MLLGSGAEFREEAAFSQSPGSSLLGLLILYMLASLPVEHGGYQKHKAFLFFSSPYHPQEGPSLRNVVLLHDP